MDIESIILCRNTDAILHGNQPFCFSHLSGSSLQYRSGAFINIAVANQLLNEVFDPIVAVGSLCEVLEVGFLLLRNPLTSGSKGLGLRPGGCTTVAVDSSRSRAVVSTVASPFPTVSATYRSFTSANGMI